MFRKIFTALIATFALSAAFFTSAASAQDYRIRSGDTLRIEVLEDPSLNRSVLVAPDGRINVPLAGSVQAGGRSLSAVEQALTAQLAPNFATAPNVYVALERQRERRATSGGSSRTIDIYVVGEAGNPGKLEVEPGTTVLQAFGLMGGFTKFAAQKRLQLHRANSIQHLDYRAIETGRSTKGMMALQDGDVILVPQRRLFE